jgi:hypothetical protein
MFFGDNSTVRFGLTVRNPSPLRVPILQKVYGAGRRMNKLDLLLL